MVKSAESFQYKNPPQIIGGPFLTSIQKITGTYSGKKRPNAVEHLKEIEVMPAMVEYDYPGWGYRAYTNFCSLDRGDELMTLFASTFDKVEYSLLNQLYKRARPQDLSFNLFNFLYEAREIPSLADPLKVSLKRLSKPKLSSVPRRLRPKVAKAWTKEVAKDVADTYVNGQFGYVPTISDSFELSSRIRTLSESYQGLKKLLGKRRQSRFQETVSQLSAVTAPSPVTGGYSTITIKKATCSVSASWTYEIPMLESFAFLSSGLDQMGLHFDLATVWNAVPWTWLVDWIIPIGDALAADRKGWTEINTNVIGTVSWAIEYEIRLDPRTYGTWAGRPWTRGDGGLITGKYYFRNVIRNLDPYRFPVSNLLGGWSGKRAGILSAMSLKTLSKKA